MSDVAYKIVDAAEWRAAIAEGHYDGAPVDLADGYIHISTQAQLTETARRHFAGRGDLLLLTVDLGQPCCVGSIRNRRTSWRSRGWRWPLCRRRRRTIRS